MINAFEQNHHSPTFHLIISCFINLSIIPQSAFAIHNRLSSITTNSPSDLATMFPTKNILAIASTMAMLSQTTLAAPGVLTARNGCYKAGLSWAAAGLTDDTWITTACNLFVGSFANGQTKYQCYQPPNDNDRIDLSISGNGILALQE